ncbi:hypothetical protein [Mucilaginibacter aquariorum]|uniref:Uncharacterized protein n=1 Tax=Mucilaginibacter aquariorum TaxID=2967225 RepID=A0ABT1SZY3_9SPHI|nr:hypothetical protein [Mucilaginibacter aquariorum]MCQ6957910.1 hypothetical protein [Mucilaginibacter aquariorum]
MRKPILIALLLLAGLLTKAQTTTPYLNANWMAADSVAKDISGRLGNGYTISETVVIDEAGRNLYELKSSELNRLVNMELFQGKTGGDADMGKPAQKIIQQVNITGLFADLYPVYAKMFDITASADDIKAKGSTFIPAVKQGSKLLLVSFSRSFANIPGEWLLQFKIN